MASHTPQIAALCLAFVFLADSASAQSSVFITGTGFAELKALSETVSIYGNAADSDLDGTTAGGGVRIGTFLHPRWSIELAVDTAAKADGTAPYNPVILADISGLGLRIPDFRQSIQFLTVSTTVGYHPAMRGRLRPGYLFGLSFVSSTYKSQYPGYYIQAADAVRASAPLSSVVPTIYPPPPLATQTITSTHNTTAAILGFETAISFGTHLAVVPEVRALAFSTNNVGGVFLIRPGVGVRWSF